MTPSSVANTQFIGENEDGKSSMSFRRLAFQKNLSLKKPEAKDVRYVICLPSWFPPAASSNSIRFLYSCDQASKVTTEDKSLQTEAEADLKQLEQSIN
mmetsp:Transcript_332/g.808  ORF Transcript_332/g.808 Transcript_332/m.808 type:complete len:98 (+) Transcript_332:196-489(+)